MSSVPSANIPQPSATVSPFWGRLNGFSDRLQIASIHRFAAALVFAALALVTATILVGERSTAPTVTLLLLAVAAAIAERQGVRVASHTHTSVSVLPILFTAVVFGPIDGMFVALCALLPYFEVPYVRWAVWTSSRVVVAGLAGLVAGSLLSSEPSFAVILFAVAGATVVEGVADAVLTSVTVEIRHRGTFRSTFRALLRVFALTGPLHVPVVAGLVFAYLELPSWSLLMFGVPALAAHHLLRLYQEQAKLADDLKTASSRMEQASVSFAAALVAALDARDAYTAGHSAAVAVYARDIAEALGLSEAETKRAHLAGMLHDIGKVGLPAGILEKAGPLTLSERKEMQAHSVIGERILNNIDGYADIAQIIRHHHERIDGSGYPDGLRGRVIPLVSRIIAVADAYNAMTSGRPYRDASSPEEARFRLREGADVQFDRRVVEAFERVLLASGETYRRGSRADFSIDAQWEQAPIEEVGLEAA